MSVPERMCAGCRSMKPKCELIRMVKTESGIAVDAKALKRGIYVCPDAKCIAQARKRRAFERFAGGRIDDDFYAELISYAESE